MNIYRLEKSNIMNRLMYVDDKMIIYDIVIHYVYMQLL